MADTDVAASAPVEALDLDAIEARAAAATAGPWGTDWESCGCEPGCYCGSWVRAITMPEPHGERPRDGSGYADYQYDYTEVSEMTTATAEFIAAARTDVPALAAEVRRLQRIVEAVGQRASEVVEAAMTAAGARPADLDSALTGGAVALQRLVQYGRDITMYEEQDSPFMQGVDAMVSEARRRAEAVTEGRTDG